MQGQILGNRYELIEKIGGGGMAIVYKAKCRFLNRFVAVKILRPEYTNDEEFVKRFLIEAQSVASLSHPNIVSIYDVGHEENVHYIVMEFVNGVTLKDYIGQKGKLPWREAVNIAIQICSAIEHAHRHHIVHRDIKPHNIMLTGDGIAKVTDFGIARAVSSSTITMVGSTIGSVHYFSPEQARGGYIGEKSDIYSMGIALYEMVTGRIPFDGETPVAVALKHIQEEAVAPREVSPDIPKALNDIIMKAVKKEQDQRYQTATDMLQDLYRVVKEPEGNFVREEVVDHAQTRRVRIIQDEKLKEKDEQKMQGKETGGKKNKADKKTIWLAIGTCAVIILAFMVLTFVLTNPGEDKKSFLVKDYVGKDIQSVEKELTDHNIEVKKTRKNDEKFDKDTVISQSVEAGKTLKPGGFIELQVSDGPKMVKVPDVIKKEWRTALSQLEANDLVGKIEDEFHDSVAEGLVIRTEPPEGTEVKAKSDVIVYKSKGPEIKETKVPGLIGLTRQQAMKALSEAKLAVGTITPSDNSIATGKVIAQSPVENTTVKEGSVVNITFEAPTPSPTPNPSATPPGNGQRVMMPEKITLNNPQKYGDKIKVRIEVTPADTNKVELLVDETVDKTDFPLTVNIPVSEKGRTKCQIYLDNILYSTFTRP